MIKLLTKKSASNAKLFTLQGAFEENKNHELVLTKDNVLTEVSSDFTAYVFLGKKADFNYDKLQAAVASALNYKRDVQVDVSSFVTDKISSAQVISLITEAYLLKHATLYSAKTVKKDTPPNWSLFNHAKADSAAFEKARLLAEARNYARNFQMTPPNVLNSEAYAKTLAEDFKTYPNVKVTVLTKKEIQKHKMGLLLGVNAGSAYEPRVVIFEYHNNPKQKDLTAIVGKGVTFDAGGYNIKTGGSMLNMKFDMSGSAVVAGLFKALAELKPAINVVGVIGLTDNMVNGSAITPDAVLTAMNGKSVEINNTDAEGRLVLADALVYATTQLKATRLVTIATLTGAIIVSLGSTFTGVFNTQDATWKSFKAAAAAEHELVWRMPLHADFNKFISDSLVADLKNTDLSGKGGGSSSAAMFLSHFTDNKDFMHLDIAGTADLSAVAQAPLVKSLYTWLNRD